LSLVGVLFAAPLHALQIMLFGESPQLPLEFQEFLDVHVLWSLWLSLPKVWFDLALFEDFDYFFLLSVLLLRELKMALTVFEIDA
jgi:hypothetical protein